MKNKLIELYDIAEKSNVTVMCENTVQAKSMSVMLDSGKCYIGINPFSLDSTADEIVSLAHELGHCETGSFYNPFSPFDLRSKNEHKATVWAIKKLITKADIEMAIKCGCQNRYELSEYFELPEDFIEKSLKYYFKMSY